MLQSLNSHYLLPNLLPHKSNSYSASPSLAPLWIWPIDCTSWYPLTNLQVAIKYQTRTSTWQILYNTTIITLYVLLAVCSWFVNKALDILTDTVVAWWSFSVGLPLLPWCIWLLPCRLLPIVLWLLSLRLLTLGLFPLRLLPLVLLTLRLLNLWLHVVWLWCGLLVILNIRLGCGLLVILTVPIHTLLWRLWLRSWPWFVLVRVLADLWFTNLWLVLVVTNKDRYWTCRKVRSCSRWILPLKLVRKCLSYLGFFSCFLSFGSSPLCFWIFFSQAEQLQSCFLLPLVFFRNSRLDITSALMVKSSAGTWHKTNPASRPTQPRERPIHLVERLSKYSHSGILEPQFHTHHTHHLATKSVYSTWPVQLRVISSFWPVRLHSPFVTRLSILGNHGDACLSTTTVCGPYPPKSKHKDTILSILSSESSSASAFIHSPRAAPLSYRNLSK